MDLESSQKGIERNSRTQMKQSPPPSLTPREPNIQALEETKEAKRDANVVRVMERNPRECVIALEAPTSK